MNIRQIRIITSTAISIATIGFNSNGMAVPENYHFERVSLESIIPHQTIVTVTLVHVPDGKSIADAIMTESKADMTPSGMARMKGKVTPELADHSGLYKFDVKLGMAGKRDLSLAPTVPGESEPVSGSVIFDTTT